MPIRERTMGGFTMAPLRAQEELAAPAPSMYDTLNAAFMMENDVVNAVQAMTRPSFEPDPSFDLMGTLKSEGLWDDYRDNFLGVRSRGEFNFIAGRIKEEERQRDVLLRSGWAGVAAGITAGLLSPTMFIPLLGQARGAKAVAEGAALGLAAGAAQEAPLLANQQTRTLSEAAIALGASTILGGILGGAVGMLSRGEREALEAGMANPPRVIAIFPADAGAAAVEHTGPRLASGAQTLAKILDSNPVTRSPVTDNLMSPYNEARWATAQLADAGLTVDRNALGIPTSELGTVENAVKTWYGGYVDYAKALDDAYARYIFEGNPPRLASNVRAFVRGELDKTRLSKSEFSAEVTRAIFSGDTHTNKYVAEVAKVAREKIYAPVLKGLQETKLLGEDLPELADASYVNWVFNHEAIRANPVAFMDFLAERYNRKLQEQFVDAYEKFRSRKAREEEFLTDASRSQEEIDDLRDKLGAELRTLEQVAEEQQYNALLDTIAGLRAAARELKDGKLADETYRKQLLADARDMEERAGLPLKEWKTKRAAVKRRLSGLNRARVVVEERLANKLAKIERTEELSLETLQRAARAGYRILSKMDKWSDEVLDKELSKLKTQFAKTAEVYDRGTERLAKLVDEDKTGTDTRLFALDELQQQRADRLTDVAERIADAEDLGRGALRELIQAELDAALQRIQRINARRAVRVERLKAQAAKYTPEAYGARLAEMKAARQARETDFAERFRVAGAEGVDLEAGKADFTEHARASAEKTKDKILGTYLRLPVVDMMQAERGAELPRLLGFIKSEEMWPWLEHDASKLIRTHLRTMAPDIEITRRLGSVNGEEVWLRLGEEQNAKLRAIESAVDSKGNPQKPEWKAKERERVQAEFDRAKFNLETIIKRLRHQHGLPTNPDGMAYRMGKTVMGLNVLRYMGGVTVSSVPDLARPVMRYGLLKTFRHGFLPLVTNLKELKMAKRVAQQSGVAVDAFISSRSHAILDVMDDLGRGSKFERGVDYLSGKQGIIAAFSYWTDAMKTLTASVANATLMDSIVGVAEGKASKKMISFLAENGINEDIATRIYREVQAGGATKVNGVWLPNLEDWKDQLAVRGYKAALAREVDNVIITPGVERPNWMTASTVGRMVGQFKSFAFSSTTRTLMAGLQQRDMAFVNGVAISLALGALSYYLYAVGRGGDRYEEMMKAGPDKWADEAIARSSVLAVFGLGQDLLSRIPATSGGATFSGGYTTRRGGGDLIEALLGPSFDFAGQGLNILTGIDDPTQSTVHSARLLSPYQNVTLLSRLFDSIEKSVPVPERRN